MRITMRRPQAITHFLSCQRPGGVTDGHDSLAIFNKNRSIPAKRIIFSSDDLPEGIDDRARFSLWRGLYTGFCGAFDLSHSGSNRFSMRSEWTRFGAIRLAQSGGTISRVVRTPREIAVDGDDGFCLTLSCGQSRVAVRQHGREAVLEGGM